MAESNAYELARLQEALASELGELGISLAVERGRVYLGGVVGTEERRQRIAAQIARRAEATVELRKVQPGEGV